MNARPQPHVGTNDWNAPDTFMTPGPKDRVFELIGSTAPDGPTFEDDVWDLTALPGWAAGHTRSKALSFDRIPVPWRDLAKVACLFQFAPEVVGAHLGIDMRLVSEFGGGKNPATVQRWVEMFGYTVMAVLHAGKDPSTGRFAGVHDGGWEKCAALIRHGAQAGLEGRVTGTPLDAETALTRARTLVFTDRVAQVCGWEEPFGSVPFEGAKVDRYFLAAGQNRDPFNRVRPNPECLTATALAAFFFESGIAENIVDAAEWWSTIPATADPVQAVADLMVDLLNEHDALPESRHHLSYGAIAWQTLTAAVGHPDIDTTNGFKRAVASKVCDAMGWEKQGNRRTWLNKVDTAPIGVCGVQPVAVTSRIDDVERQWCAPSDLNVGWSFDWLVTSVSIMAAVLLHGVTAMRPNDRHYLDLDSVEQFTDETGFERYRLNCWKTKWGAATPRPEPVDFAIPARLAHALNLVKRLHGVLGIEGTEIRGLADHGITGKHHLFDSALSRYKSGDMPGEILDITARVDDWVNGVLARLIEADLVTPIEPLGHFNLRQMRITVEQAHQSHDYGPALAAHYGAWSSDRVQFGYIGDVRRGPEIATDSLKVFVDDNRRQKEQRDAERGFMLLDLAARYDELNDAGQHRIADIAIRHRDTFNVANLTMRNEKQVMKALAEIGGAEQLGVTPFVACVYNPERALCDGSGYANPQDCRPAACRNAIQTREMRAAYELERRALEWVVELNPRSLFKARLDQLTEDGEQIIDEFANYTDEALHRLIVEGSMVGKAIPVDITPKEGS